MSKFGTYVYGENQVEKFTSLCLTKREVSLERFLKVKLCDPSFFKNGIIFYHNKYLI